MPSLTLTHHSRLHRSQTGSATSQRRLKTLPVPFHGGDLFGGSGDRLLCLIFRDDDRPLPNQCQPCPGVTQILPGCLQTLPVSTRPRHPVAQEATCVLPTHAGGCLGHGSRW
jgi:hypothetical protein